MWHMRAEELVRLGQRFDFPMGSPHGRSLNFWVGMTARTIGEPIFTCQSAFQLEQVVCRVGHRTVMCYVTSSALINQHHILETQITWCDIALARENETESLTVVSSWTTISICPVRTAPSVLTFRGLLQNCDVTCTAQQNARHVRGSDTIADQMAAFRGNATTPYGRCQAKAHIHGHMQVRWSPGFEGRSM
jgi:hypothetical protein